MHSVLTSISEGCGIVLRGSESVPTKVTGSSAVLENLLTGRGKPLKAGIVLGQQDRREFG